MSLFFFTFPFSVISLLFTRTSHCVPFSGSRHTDRHSLPPWVHSIDCSWIHSLSLFLILCHFSLLSILSSLLFHLRFLSSSTCGFSPPVSSLPSSLPSQGLWRHDSFTGPFLLYCRVIIRPNPTPQNSTPTASSTIPANTSQNSTSCSEGLGCEIRLAIPPDTPDQRVSKLELARCVVAQPPQMGEFEKSTG